VSIMLSALVLSIYDTHLTSKNAQLAASLSDANRELKSMVYRDSLTTLPNRLHFEEKIEEILQQGSDSFSVFFWLTALKLFILTLKPKHYKYSMLCSLGLS